MTKRRYSEDGPDGAIMSLVTLTRAFGSSRLSPSSLSVLPRKIFEDLESPI
jgi:hypothetical protein